MTAEAERKIGQDPRALRERAGLTQGAAAIRLQVQRCGILAAPRPSRRRGCADSPPTR